MTSERNAAVTVCKQATRLNVDLLYFKVSETMTRERNAAVTVGKKIVIQCADLLQASNTAVRERDAFAAQARDSAGTSFRFTNSFQIVQPRTRQAAMRAVLSCAASICEAVVPAELICEPASWP